MQRFNLVGAGLVPWSEGELVLYADVQNTIKQAVEEKERAEKLAEKMAAAAAREQASAEAENEEIIGLLSRLYEYQRDAGIPDAVDRIRSRARCMSAREERKASIQKIAPLNVTLWGKNWQMLPLKINEIAIVVNDILDRLDGEGKE